MTELRRLCDASADAELRAVLEAGIRERPGAQVLSGVHAALTAGHVVSTHAALAAAARAGAEAAKGSAALASGAPASALVTASQGVAAVIGKSLAMGVLGGALVCGSVSAVQGRARHARSLAPAIASARASFPPLDRGAQAKEPVTRAAVELPPALAPVSPVPSGAPALRSRPASLPKAAPSAIAVPSAVSPVSSAAVTPHALRAEIEQIDRARQALRAGDVDGANAQLNAYDSGATTGVLEREALLLRIDVARQRGDSAVVRELGARYLQAYPGDAHAPRIQQMLRDSNVQ